MVSTGQSKISGVYRIKNILNDKVYVGSSVNISKRWNWHLTRLNAVRHHNKKLQRSWSKHGSRAFVFEIINICSPEMLLIREQFWIDKLKTVSSGYNILPIAGSALGRKHSEETKQKLRDSRARLLEDPAQRQALSDRARAQHAAGKLGRQTWNTGTRKQEDPIKRKRYRAGTYVKKIQECAASPDAVAYWTKKLRAYDPDGLYV